MSEGEFGSVKPNWTNAIVNQYVEELREYKNKENKEEKGWSIEKPHVYVLGASNGFCYSIAEAVYHLALGLFRAAQALIGLGSSPFMATPLFPEATRLVVLEHFVQVGRYTLLTVPLFVCPFIFGLEETAEAFGCLKKEVQPQEQAQPADKSATIINLQGQIGKLQRELEEANTAKGTLTKHLRESSKALSQRAEKSSQLASELTALQKKVEQLEQSETSLKGANAILETKKTHLELRIQAANFQAQQQKGIAENKIQEIEKLKKQIQEVRESQASLSTTSRAQEEANRQLEETKKNCEELKQRLAEKESECTEKDETIDVLKKEIESLEALVKGHDPFLLEKEQTIQEKDKEIERLNKRFHEIWKENRSLKEAKSSSPSAAFKSQPSAPPTPHFPPQTLSMPSTSTPRQPIVPAPVILQAQPQQPVVATPTTPTSPRTPSSLPSSVSVAQPQQTPTYTVTVVPKGGSFILPDDRESIKELRRRGIQADKTKILDKPAKTDLEKLLIWLNNCIQPYGFCAKWGKNSWTEGKPLFALADILEPGFFLKDYGSVEGPNIAKINAAFDIFNRYGAGKLLDADELGVEVKSIQTYVIEIHKHCFDGRGGAFPGSAGASVQTVASPSTTTLVLL